MAPPLFAQERLITSLVTLLVASAVVYLAARMVLDRSSILASIVTVVLGTFLSALVAAALPGLLGILVAAAVWALVAAFFFRTEWLKGAIVGLVAWALWALIGLVVDALA